MTSGAETTPEPLRNEDLADVHRELVSLSAALDRAIDEAPDAATVRRLTAQIAALNVRITAVGRQLFATRSAEIAAAARDIHDSIPEVERALADLASLDDALSGLTAVLGIVDKAVGIANSAG
ncbi:hypothetical protein [Sphingomonas sp. BK580]|uniref:hypothetical protein n=1 Tax=Sphingomonas sp. BK580 TaxID=2586972 RepID=UPI00161542C6|nr:hypothetical protein [Sphingomonas sp. BK580]MBB3693582.1 hypothetical protein [Sphingomonas sp. BK580]